MDYVILSPNLGTRSIVKQKTNRLVTFYCGLKPDNINSNLIIELWSNLTSSQEWRSFPFVKMKQQEGYHLAVDISKLSSGRYEFTLRLKTFHDREWIWYGEPHQNGQIIVLGFSPARFIPPVIQRVHQLQLVSKEYDINNTIDLYHLSVCMGQKILELGSVGHTIHGYVSFLRKGPTWLTPVSGTNNFNQNDAEKHQLLIYQDEERGDIHLWMTVSSSIDSWLSFGPNNTIRLHCQTDNIQTNNNPVHLLILTTRNERDFSDLTKIATNYYYKNIANILDELDKVSNASEDPILLNSLGYCTWNAFGKSIDHEKLCDALTSLVNNQIPIGYIMLDDGWQHVTSDGSQLLSFDACSTKFPKGLKQTVLEVKQRYPAIKYIGVWHTLWGYWQGISAELGNIRGYDYYELKEKKGSFVGLLKKPEQFYQEFSSFLKESYVDFVKVDNQGGFQELLCDSEMRFEIWDNYRQALVDTSDKKFNGKVIHCMALTPHIMFNPILSYRTKSTFRNSDDFFPNVADSHDWHIYANAINSLWTRHYPTVADWDMFQSDHPFAEYHASSRAISGGPVYITDFPGKHNPDLIEKLVGMQRSEELTLLRSRQPPNPTFDTVLKDPMGVKGLLCLYNLNREEITSDSESLYVVCGFWNTSSCTNLGIVNSNLFNREDIFKSLLLAYVVTGIDQGKILPLYPSDSSMMGDNVEINKLVKSQRENTLITRVAGYGSTLISISCTKSLGNISVACLGLLDKLNGTRAILKTEFSELKQHSVKDEYYMTYRAYLSHKSKLCGFWISKGNVYHTEYNRDKEEDPTIKKIWVDSCELDSSKDWHWNKSNGLLTVNMLGVPLSSSNLSYFVIEIHMISVRSLCT
ncbi:hypothetical protein G6F56_000234 [Rhizopus delemar]|uniref:Uncharacterized protein n=1 Tax=Rhizopus stolonifer TaxID=4846 RepID=A0A367JUX8_RHIST|nr:hypothetical protein G6F56_000234 [Rhizopus delemar]RCH93717.1 hypothetical protein CU098_004351 [Rhizopus stolonifer]